MKRFIAIACVGVLGCAKHVQPTVHRPGTAQYELRVDIERVEQCPYVRAGTKYIPEAKEFIDYLTDSKDFESWHYMGRGRNPYDWEREIHAAELAAAESPDVSDVQDRLKGLKEKYAEKIKESEIADAARYDKMIKDIIVERNGGNFDQPATSGK